MLFPSTLAVGEINYTPMPESMEQKIERIFGEDSEIMKRVFRCESGLKQFKENGEVLKSPTGDYGISQINEASWDKTAKELGLDYKNSEDDNLTMAKYILEKQGMKAWTCYKNGV